MAYTPLGKYEGEHWIDLTEDELLEAQEKLENLSHEMGQASWGENLQRARSKGSGSQIGSTPKLITLAMRQMTDAIQQWVEQDRPAGRRPQALEWLRRLDYRVAAYLTLRAAFDYVMNTEDGPWRVKQVKLATAISRSLYDEMRYNMLKKVAPHFFEYRRQKTGTLKGMPKRRASLHQAVDWSIEAGIVDNTEMQRIDVMKRSLTVQILVGTTLIDLMLSATGLFDIERDLDHRGARSHGRVVGTKYKTLVFVALKPEVVEKLDLADRVLMDLATVAHPMVVEPLDWDETNSGGFRFRSRGQHGFVRKKKDQPSIPQRVFDAVNVLQDTAWQINPDVYELLVAIRGGDGGRWGIPPFNPLPKPIEPPGASHDPTLRVRHIARLREWHEDENLRPLEVANFLRVYRAAEQMRSYERFYFPYSVDFRGRIYPMVSRLSPQGNDLQKALLRFAEPQPIGERGDLWLGRHLINCLGDTPEGDKVSLMTLGERDHWVLAHEAELRMVAQKPFGKVAAKYLEVADEPLQFYAACCEYDRYVRSDRSPDFLTYIPCSIDGTCNGLQHFAALTRDTRTAAAVNMLSLETPQDLYAVIANDVKDRLTNWKPTPKCKRCVVRGFEEDAMRWLSKAEEWITRKLTKRPTMTVGYGSKQFGFTNQILQFIREQDWYRDYVRHFTTENAEGKKQNYSKRGAEVMAHLIWESLQARVPRAFECMIWMQQCAKLVAQKSNRPMSWIVPYSGFRVAQTAWSYFEGKLRRIQTTLQGSTYVPSFRQETNKVKTMKQSNAIAPNLVHSLDAAALMLTVIKAYTEKGVRAFAMVHDSYGTHAGSMAKLAAATREAFLEIHSENLLEYFYEQFKLIAPEVELPPPPARGNLDLEQVIESKYFFV